MTSWAERKPQGSCTGALPVTTCQSCRIWHLEKTSVAPRSGHTTDSFLSLPLLKPEVTKPAKNRHWTLDRLVGMLNVSWSRQPQSFKPQNPRSWEGRKRTSPNYKTQHLLLTGSPGFSAKEMTAVIRAGVSARPQEEAVGGWGWKEVSIGGEEGLVVLIKSTAELEESQAHVCVCVHACKQTWCRSHTIPGLGFSTEVV